MATNNSINTPLPFEISKGGTGLETLTTPYGILCAGTTSTGPVQNAGAGVAAQVLLSNGASALPTFQDIGIGGFAFIETATASTSATIEFNSLTGFKNYEIHITNLLPSTDNVRLAARVSEDNGSTWASAYEGSWLAAEGSSANADELTSTTNMRLLENMSNVATEESFLIVTLHNPSGGIHVTLTTQATGMRAAGTMQCTTNTMQYNSSNTVNAIEFFMESGTIATGTFKLYGIGP